MIDPACAACAEAAAVKTDRKDARGIAEIMRLGGRWPVHCKSIGAGHACAAERARTVAV